MQLCCKMSQEKLIPLLYLALISQYAIEPLKLMKKVRKNVVHLQSLPILALSTSLIQMYQCTYNTLVPDVSGDPPTTSFVQDVQH